MFKIITYRLPESRKSSVCAYFELNTKMKRTIENSAQFLRKLSLDNICVVSNKNVVFLRTAA